MSEAMSTPFWIGPILGGVALASMSAGSSYFVEKETPNIKTLMRDFILGAVIMMLIAQILPESVAKLVIMITSIFSFNSVMKGGSSELISTDIPLTEDVEVRVGVPKF